MIARLKEMMTYEHEEAGPNQHNLTCKSIFGTTNVIVLSDDQYRRFQSWRDRDSMLMIQDALHDLSENEREIILTGMNSEQFAEACGNDEDLDDEDDEEGRCVY